MEKIYSLLWIVLGLGVFVWRMMQKAQATTAREQQQRPPRTRQAPPLPAASFEELLQQMQAGNRPGPVEPAARQTTPAGRSVPREAAAPARSLERQARAATSLETTPDARSLESAPHEARRAASQPRASRRPDEPADYWARQQARAHEPARATVTDLLRSPADLRAAFVLNEILQRRF